MTDPAKNKLNEFIINFPKKDIIKILNDIDGKIGELHNASSKDFLYFNKLLKEYYPRVKEISETNNKINLFFRKDLSGFISTAQEINAGQQVNLSNIDVDINSMVEKLISVYSAFDLLVVPFNNYKQNLITLKYLLANINLHLTYVDLPNKEKLKETIKHLNQTIFKASGNNEKVTEQKEQLLQEINDLKNSALILKSKNNTEVVENLRKLEIEFKKLNNEEYWPENFLHRISSHSQNCLANMGEIITNLQYHDIIRQKMEHIQTSQKDLISGLSTINEQHDTDELEEKLKIIIRIPEITDIQVAQLLYTNKDYQTSIEKITSKLIEVGRETKELNDLYISIGTNTETFEKLFLKQLDSTQRNYIEYSNEFIKNWTNTSQKISYILDQYAALKENLNDLFGEENKIRQEIKSFEKIIKSNNKNYSSDLIKRLIVLVADLKLNSNSLKNSLNNITTQTIGLSNISKKLTKETEAKELAENAISELENQVIEIRNLNLEYSKASLTISNEITESLKNIKYYKFFENTVEEIVKMLNEINSKINYEDLKKEISYNDETLKRIEALYTMKSERDIHSKLTESGLKADEIFNNDSAIDDSDDSDIELF